jgi:hypothetical protein
MIVVEQVYNGLQWIAMKIEGRTGVHEVCKAVRGMMFLEACDPAA